jgi:prepilin-type N-terminal cleavage/methylation domain-containing protein
MPSALMQSKNPQPRHGFSLIELLVVIGLIALLIAIILVVVSRVREQAGFAECQSNQHQLQVGLVGYSMEHGGKFISPRTAPLGGLSSKLLWARSYNGDGQIRINPDGTESLHALEDGALWDYVGDDAAYRSPLDPTGRLRSYSLNGFISDMPDNNQNPEFSWAPIADRLSKIRNPANTLYVIPEDDGQPFNLHGWVIHVYNYQWIDYPIDWFEKGKTTVAYVDGSTGKIDYANPNLLEDIDGHWATVNESTEVDFRVFDELVRVDR